MEDNCQKRNVAIIEKCMMSEVGLRHLFNETTNKKYSFHFFNDPSVFRQALKQMPFFSVIYSLFGQRGERNKCMKCLFQTSVTHPGVRRIILAEGDREAQLVGLITPSHVHGILSKSSSLPELLEQIMSLFDDSCPVNGSLVINKYVSHCRMLSPTERQILSYMTRGFSVAEIALQLDRNVKTIRAHKFNAMTKLGVSSDVGLLEAADILTWIPPEYGLRAS